MSAIDTVAIRSRLDLVELLGRITGHGVRVHGHTATSSCPNPAHAQTGKTPPCSIDITRGLWRCHGCGAGGDAITAIALSGGLATGEAIRAAAALAGMRADDWPLRAAPPRVTVADRGPRGVVTPLDGADRLRAEYAATRRWPVETLDRLGVVVASVDRVPRLIIPADPADVTRGAQGRTLRDGRASRWWSVRQFVEPYGASLIGQSAPGDVVIVAEGGSDFVSGAVLRGANPSMPLVVAAPGASAWRAGWASLLAGHIAVVIGDPDEAGRRYVDAVAADCITHGVPLATASWPGGDDLSAYLSSSSDDLPEVTLAVCAHIDSCVADVVGV
jgi:CHC2 zinc finger